MLDYELAHWIAFLTTALVLNLSPGPDIAFILGHTVRSGRRHGIAAMFGLWVGAFCHVIFAVAGLTAILAASALAFSIVKWVGVVYLVWLGIQALRAKGSAFEVRETRRKHSLRGVFLQGVLVDILNPKVAIFFLAFLPQFVVPGAGPVWLQLLVHGCLIIAVAAVVEPPMILLGDRITSKLRDNRRFAVWLDRTLGVLFIGLAARLAAAQR